MMMFEHSRRKFKTMLLKNYDHQSNINLIYFLPSHSVSVCTLQEWAQNKGTNNRKYIIKKLFALSVYQVIRNLLR